MTRKQRYASAIRAIEARKDEVSFRRGIRAIRSLASSRYRPALMALGCFYDYGLGLPKNPRLAARYYRKAAERGDGGAQFNLAVSLEFGYGIKRDLAQAKKWYAAAARKGVKEARGQAARLSKTR